MKKKESSPKRAKPQDSGDVDAYLRSLPAHQRAALQKLRKTIAASAPGAVEGFSYGLPAFRLEGRPIAAYAASKNHCSYFPMSPAVIRALADDLKRFDTSKGTIRFTADRPLPAALVRKLVRARLAELGRPKR